MKTRHRPQVCCQVSNPLIVSFKDAVKGVKKYIHM